LGEVGAVAEWSEMRCQMKWGHFKYFFFSTLSIMGNQEDLEQRSDRIQLNLKNNPKTTLREIRL
jgi:hypothetical protein